MFTCSEILSIDVGKVKGGTLMAQMKQSIKPVGPPSVVTVNIKSG